VFVLQEHEKISAEAGDSDLAPIRLVRAVSTPVTSGNIDEAKSRVQRSKLALPKLARSVSFKRDDDSTSNLVFTMSQNEDEQTFVFGDSSHYTSAERERIDGARALPEPPNEGKSDCGSSSSTLDPNRIMGSQIELLEKLSLKDWGIQLAVLKAEMAAVDTDYKTEVAVLGTQRDGKKEKVQAHFDAVDLDSKNKRQAAWRVVEDVLSGGKYLRLFNCFAVADVRGRVVHSPLSRRHRLGSASGGGSLASQECKYGMGESMQAELSIGMGSAQYGQDLGFTGSVRVLDVDALRGFIRAETLFDNNGIPLAEPFTIRIPLFALKAGTFGVLHASEGLGLTADLEEKKVFVRYQKLSANDYQPVEVRPAGLPMFEYDLIFNPHSTGLLTVQNKAMDRKVKCEHQLVEDGEYVIKDAIQIFTQIIGENAMNVVAMSLNDFGEDCAIENVHLAASKSNLIELMETPFTTDAAGKMLDLKVVADGTLSSSLS
jgi:hypothetical protein